MKKLKKLSLNKVVISKLDATKVTGGTAGSGVSNPPWCPDASLGCDTADPKPALTLKGCQNN
ncbi:hypothetical protein BKI52_23960 [marine bacterium AO1-C]|nr:hypothetical protein BKI52_23960 [marine bacterium AO1-C]